MALRLREARAAAVSAAAGCRRAREAAAAAEAAAASAERRNRRLEGAERRLQAQLGQAQLRLVRTRLFTDICFKGIASCHARACVP
jgi:hypothetical protein